MQTSLCFRQTRLFNPNSQRSHRNLLHNEHDQSQEPKGSIRSRKWGSRERKQKDYQTYADEVLPFLYEATIADIKAVRHREEEIKRLFPRKSKLSSALITAYCQAGLPDDAAREFTRSLLFMVPDPQLWFNLMYSYLQQDQILPALELLNTMDSRKIVPLDRTWVALVTYFRNKGDLMAAFEFLTDRSKRPDFKDLYNGWCKLLVLFGTNGDIDRQSEVFWKMIDLGYKIGGKVSTAFLTSLQKAGRVDDVVSALRQLRSSSDDNAYAWNCTLTALGKANRTSEMFDLLEEMKASNIPPTGVNWATTLEMAGSNGMEHMISLFEKMKPQLTTFEPWERVIGAYADNGDCEGAMSLFREMQTLMAPPSSTWGSILKALLNANRIPEAMALFRDNKSQFMDPIPWNVVLSHLVKNEQMEDAMPIWTEIKGTDRANRYTWNIMMSGMSQIGTNEMMELFNDMKKHDSPDLVTYTTLITQLSRRGSNRVFQINREAMAAFPGSLDLIKAITAARTERDRLYPKPGKGISLFREDAPTST